MKKLLFIPLLLLSLLASPSWAQDLGKGVVAASNGDYATALGEFTPLAEHENARVQYNMSVSYLRDEGVPQDYIYAYMWGDIAASNGYESGGKLRDDVAGKMTPAEIIAAKALARECVAKDYKGC